MKYTMNILGPHDMLVIKIVFFFRFHFVRWCEDGKVVWLK